MRKPNSRVDVVMGVTLASHLCASIAARPAKESQLDMYLLVLARDADSM